MANNFKLNLTNPFGPAIQEQPSGFSLFGRTQGPLGVNPGTEIATGLGMFDPAQRQQQGPTQSQYEDLQGRYQGALSNAMRGQGLGSALSGIASIMGAVKLNKMRPEIEKLNQEKEDLQEKMAQAKVAQETSQARKASEQISAIDQMNAMDDARSMVFMDKEVPQDLIKRAEIMTNEDGTPMTFQQMVVRGGMDPKKLKSLIGFDANLNTVLRSPVSRKDVFNKQLKESFRNAQQAYRLHQKNLADIASTKADTSLKTLEKVSGMFDKLNDNIARTDLVYDDELKGPMIASNLDMMSSLYKYARNNNLPLSMKSWSTLAAGNDLFNLDPQTRQSEFSDLYTNYKSAIGPILKQQSGKANSNSLGADKVKNPKKLSVSGSDETPKKTKPSKEQIKAKRDELIKANPTLINNPDMLAEQLRRSF